MKKKILSLFYVIGLFSLLFSFINSNADTYYRFDVDNNEITFLHGMEHRRVNGTMTYGTRITSQYYNYVNISNSTTGYHLVSVDGYANGKYGMHSLETFIEVFERENPHMEVMAGVNGDFYHINTTGQSLGTYVRDYEVITPGDNNTISLVTDNEGKSSFKNVQLDGNELIILNKYNEVKFREKVSALNTKATSDDKLTILFDNYIGDIPKDLKTTYVLGEDIKPLTGRNKEHANYYTYAKGNFIENLNEEKVPQDHFVIISETVNEIMEEGDIAVFQSKIKDFENVKSAVSTSKARGPLVINGEINPVTWDEAHPRTAIGIKENGDVFFIVVDGRDRITPKHGVFLSEFAHLMHSYGAVEAYNFDGGGSSTLMIRNNVQEGAVLDRFDVLNDLSDGRLRSLSNAYLVVKGEPLSKPLDIRGVSNRNQFDRPSNLFIDDKLNLNFDDIVGAERYEIFINDFMFETTSNKIPLKGLYLGENKIKVRVKGTIENSTSNNSDTLIYKVHSSEVRALLNLLKKFN